MDVNEVMQDNKSVMLLEKEWKEELRKENLGTWHVVLFNNRSVEDHTLSNR